MNKQGKHYCIADVHGDYERYRQMLSLIQLRSVDTLFVLGDVLDRGEGGIRILQDMMMRDNVIPLLGNHEYMAANCLQWLLQPINEETIAHLDGEHLQGLQEWIAVGGAATLSAFWDLSPQERLDILDYLADFTLFEELTIDKRNFVLVHAGLANFTKERSLEDYDIAELIFLPMDYTVGYDNCTIVSGHIPTRSIYESMLTGDEIKPSNRDTIYCNPHHIAIDCGCGFGGRLGCICLESMECYYV